MIDKILEFALRQRSVVVLGACALVIAGIASALHLRIDAVPDITGVQVQVNTEVPALAAEESEKLVTQPIEQEMAGLPGLEEMRSLTKFGLSQVTLQFHDGTDLFRARQLVAERMQGVADRLPTGSSSRLAPISTGLGEIFYYSLRYAPEATGKPATEREQLMALGELQEYVVKPLLRTVPGLAEVNSIGGHEKQFVIQPRPAALVAAGLTFSEVADLVAQNVENAGGGIINRGTEQLTIRAIGRVGSVDELADLPLKFGGAVKPLLVRDVADVKLGARFRTGAATRNGQELVIGSTMMLIGENGGEVAKRVRDRLEEIKKKLPAGVVLETEYDRSELVGRTIWTVQKNLFEGATLVIAVLLVMLGNWRAALIVSAAVPLSFLFALTGMNVFGISGNLMSLGAVDFGLIIDGAIFIVENIVLQLGHRQQHLGRALTAAERSHTVLAASKQVGLPVFFGVVIITVVYIPILALTGTEGKMFRPMALTVMLALGGALVLALTLMPALCSYILRQRIDEKDIALVRFAKRVYAPVLDFALRARWLVIGGAVLLFAGAMALFTRLGAEFMPTLDEGSITAMFYKPVGLSLDASIQTDLEVERRLLQEFPEITRVFTRIGTAEVATDPMPANECDVYIFYKPLADWPKTAGRPTTKAELNAQIEAMLKKMNPDFSILFAQPIQMRFNEMLEGTKAELAVKIFGQDYDELERLAGQIKGIAEKTPGTAQVEFETEGRTPQLQITPKRDVLRRYGIPSGEINRAVSSALAGQTVGKVVDGNRRFDIVVRMPDELRADDAEIKKLPLRVGEHGLLPLGSAVEFSTLKTVEPIRRDDGQRRAALMINLSTRDIEGYVGELERRIARELKFPAGYSVEFGGQFKNLQEARERLAFVVPAALALIFVLIFFAFGSMRQALLVYSGIPLAVTGGVLALWLRDMTFSITAANGFIALMGVAVLNGVMLVSYFNQLREDGKDVREAVVEGSLTRLRPVLMTALVAALGFLPMALATGPGAEVQRPLATVVIGGIASATVLTLLVLPALYATFERRPPEDEEPEPAAHEPPAALATEGK